MKSKLEELKEKLKNVSKTIFISLAITAVSVSGFLFYESGYAYQVALNGEEIGVVKQEVFAESALDEVEKEVLSQFGKQAYFEKELTYEKVRVPKERYLDQDQLEDIMTENIDIYKPATIVEVDGEEVLVLETEEDAEYILEEIQKPFQDMKDKENTKLIEVAFNQEVELQPKDVLVEEILSKDQALEEVEKSSQQVQTYQVAQGDSAWNISRSFSMGVRSLEDANPDKNIEKLQPGEEINLYVEKPFLDVVTTLEQSETEDINFEKEEKKDSSMYVGEKKVEQKGKKGEKKITKEITLLNGSVDKEKVINEEIVKEPTKEITLVGTKERPVAQTTSRSSSSNSGSKVSTSKKPAPTYNGSKGSAIVQTARHYMGIPYVSGGASPSGFDCSGFTQYVYRQYGISLPRTSGGQRSVGSSISRSDLQPGDLVAFSGHVGIYVGGSSFIHSPRPGKSVQISSLNSSYWSSRFISGRRVY